MSLVLHGTRLRVIAIRRKNWELGGGGKHCNVSSQHEIKISEFGQVMIVHYLLSSMLHAIAVYECSRHVLHYVNMFQKLGALPVDWFS